MKDLSFVAPIVDQRWFGLVPQRPSSMGPVTRVVRNVGQGSVFDTGVWWSIYFGHISWGVRTDHPADVALLEFAWRHSP